MHIKVKPIELDTFLASKPLYYDKIDLQRMPDAFKSIEHALRVPPIIHIVGTNGKGTTGRFLASALRRSGLSVGHYTSPHIRSFNERIWLDGADVSDEALESAHQKLLGLLDVRTAEALSYFEYTTFLAMLIFASCDWVILEAGLGGEFDATNVFAKHLSIFTPIDIDHQAFLGDTIASIAMTKLRSMGPRALIGVQPHQEVYELFSEIAEGRGTKRYLVQELLEAADIKEIAKSVLRHGLPEYLAQNLSMAAAAMKVIGLSFDSESFMDTPLFGRMSVLDEHIIVDVGHNVLAARAIVKSLKGKKMVLVYNSYKDKDYMSILNVLRPIVRHVEIIAVEDERIEEPRRLHEAVKANGLTSRAFTGVEDDKDYLVFGSFSVIEQFLKVYDGK